MGRIASERAPSLTGLVIPSRPKMAPVLTLTIYPTYNIVNFIKSGYYSENDWV